MKTRTRLVVASAAVAALALTGTASAAAAPKPGPTKSGTATPATKPDTALIAAAAALGVTPDRLLAAMVAAKTALAGTHGSDTEFVAAVATDLGLPVAQVQAGLAFMIAQPGHGQEDPNKDDPGPDDPANSPFATDAAAAALATALGVDQADAKTALAAILTLAAGNRGVDPSSPAFRDIAAGLGVSADRLRDALGDLKASLAQG